MTTSIDIERRGRVCLLWLDGPAQLNALGSSTFVALAAALHALREDGAIGALVITGRGRAFSAGADLAEISAMTTSQEFGDFIHRFTDTLALIEDYDKPVVAAINGAALGGGLELSLACDLRVAVATARLGVPEIKLGVIPGAGGTQRLPRLLPAAIARQMLLTGEPITARRAFEVGLLNDIVEADGPSVVDTAVAMADGLATGPGLAHRKLKVLLSKSAAISVADGIAMERQTAVELFDSHDRVEGLAAFHERRAPHFSAH